MKARWTVAVAVMAAASWVGIAAAQGTGFRQGRPGFAAGRAFERLDLTDQQKDQIKAIRQKNRDAAKPLVDAVRQAHANLKTAMEAKKPDAAAVGQATLALHDARLKLQASRRATFDEIKSVLTPEQLEKMDSWKQHRRHRGQASPQQS